MKSTKADKVTADAAKIVERLRKFPAATVKGFCREYGVKSDTMMRAIRTVISDEEFYELRRLRKEKRHRILAADVAAERIKRKKAMPAAEDLRHEAIHKANIAELRGETTVWYQCRGCGFDSGQPVLPCPKCGHLSFERIEQPVQFARRQAVNE